MSVSRILSRVPLKALLHFEAVLRQGSFDAAARELHVTPGAVSQQIKRLEESLEIKLFTRQGNRAVPSGRAQELALALSDAFGQIETALEDCAGHKSASAAVRVKVYQTWANRWLIPRLDGFSKANPSVSVEFLTGYSHADIDQTLVDLAISLESDRWRDAPREMLITPHLTPVCAPGLARDIATTADMARLPRIASRNRMADWALWATAADIALDDRKPMMVFSNSTLVYEAALAGGGVAIAQVELVLADLEQGRLVQPFALTVAAEAPLFLVDLSRGPRRKAARRFHDWLLTESAHLRHRTDAYLAGLNPKPASPAA